jgi:hypothetical protein
LPACRDQGKSSEEHCSAAVNAITKFASKGECHRAASSSGQERIGLYSEAEPQEPDYAFAMASIRKEISIEAPAAAVWSTFRDIGAVHTRLAPGFVTDCRMDGKARIVTFANGFVAREVIVDIDDESRRLVYSARSENIAHHNASFQVTANGADRCRVVWVADLLPDEVAETIDGMMEQGSAAMKKALEGKRA